MNFEYANERPPEGGATTHDFAGNIPVKLTKEELGRQDAKKSSAGAGKKGAS